MKTKFKIIPLAIAILISLGTLPLSLKAEQALNLPEEQNKIISNTTASALSVDSIQINDNIDFFASVDPIPNDIASKNIIHISTPAQLAAIGGSHGEGKYFVLTNDINLCESYNPIHFMAILR